MSPNSLQLTDNYGQTFSIAGPIAQIGSGAERNIVLDGPDVLDLHVELRFEDSDWVLCDLSEGKGVNVNVNDEVVQTSQHLKDGDIIAIGNTVLRVAIEQREAEEDLSVFRGSGEIASSVTAPIAPPSERAKKRCNTCGELIYEEAEICPHCGVRQKPLAVQTTSKRSRSTAAILAILLGGIGAHRFYLGQIGWGLAYLLFSWTFIPLVAGIIEGIIYLSMDDQRFGEKYG